MSPPQVNSPIGSQVFFTCKYWSSMASELYITVDSLNVFDVKQTRFDGGAQLTFYFVIGCNQQNVSCIVHNKNNNFEVERINVLVSPGLDKILDSLCGSLRSRLTLIVIFLEL